MSYIARDAERAKGAHTKDFPRFIESGDMVLDRYRVVWRKFIGFRAGIA